MPPKVRMVAPDGKRESEPSHHGSPLGQKMGEPSVYVPSEYGSGSGSRHSTCVYSRQNGSPHVTFFSAKRGVNLLTSWEECALIRFRGSVSLTWRSNVALAHGT